MGCDVDTITLSSQQMDMVKKVAALAGVSDRVRVHLCDYRQLPAEFKNAFDALIACEMIEVGASVDASAALCCLTEVPIQAVGPKNMSEFFRMADWALKDHRAAMVITSTSRPESRYTPYQCILTSCLPRLSPCANYSCFRTDDFARHYHWPNTHLPSATSLAVSVQEAVPGKFVLYNLEDQGAREIPYPLRFGGSLTRSLLDYPRTLREWGRFAIMSALLRMASNITVVGDLSAILEGTSSGSFRCDILNCVMKQSWRRSGVSGGICSYTLKSGLRERTRR